MGFHPLSELPKIARRPTAEFCLGLAGNSKKWGLCRGEAAH
jgi:hypothetical protein